MWQRATGAVVPATTQEACALRMAEAPGRECDRAGSSMALLRQGAKRRWDRDTPTQLAGWPALANALVPGTAAVVFGSMGAFPAGSHWRRHDPGFAGNHAAEVERRDELARVWWDDPLAAPGVYRGEWMDLSDLERFVRAWPGARHLVARMNGGDMVTITDQRAGTVHLAAGSKLMELDGSSAITVSVAQDAPSPFATDKGRAVEVTTGGSLVLLLSAGPFTPTPPAVDVTTARRAEYDRVLSGLGIPARP